MAKIFGQELTKKEMLERLGNISSLAGITRLDRVGGRADGMHTYEVLNERMRFTVHADKEILMMVVEKNIRDRVLNAIYKEMGMAKKAKGIAFSLPVSDVAGLAMPEPENKE